MQKLIAALVVAATALVPPPRRARRTTEVTQQLRALSFGDDSDAAFADAAATVASESQRAAQAAAWSIVEEAYAVAEGHETWELDASAFGGALACFRTPGPSDAQLAALPPPAADIMRALGDAAGSYARVVARPEKGQGTRLGWSTAYRTLARGAGAFFGGFALWPSPTTDVPNLTLYFGSGSPANPSQLFMRLECVPRADVATDPGYAERYYGDFTATCLDLMTKDAAFTPYVSGSAYARGCQAPSGVRVFFDGADAGALAKARSAALELAGLWRAQLDAAETLSFEAQAAIRARDAVVRRVAADSSPDNANRELVYGPELFRCTKDLLAGAPAAGGPDIAYLRTTRPLETAALFAEPS